METNKLVAGIVAAAIAVIVLAGVLMPALNNATSTQDTYINVGWYYMTDTTDEHTYVFDGTKWTVDGEELQNVTASRNIIATDTFLIRGSGQLRGDYSATMASCNLTVSSGAVTGTYYSGSTEYTANWPFTTFYGASTSEADYIMSNATYSPVAYLNGDSIIFAHGITKLSDNNYYDFLITGDVDNGVTVECGVSTVTISDISVNAAPNSSHLDLYEFQSVTFTATLNGNDTAVSYNTLVVPSEVTAEKAQHLSDPMNAILNVIPIIIIVAVLLGVVAIFIIRRE